MLHPCRKQVSVWRRPERPPWTSGERRDRPRAYSCFDLAEQASEQIGSGALVARPEQARLRGTEGSRSATKTSALVAGTAGAPAGEVGQRGAVRISPARLW